MKRNLQLTALPCLLALTACGASPKTPGEAGAASPLYSTYRIEQEAITLQGGRADSTAPGSASSARTSWWEGAIVYGDLDGDGDDDAALMLVQEAGGSGAFSYLATAVQEKGRYIGGDALFIGDRIGQPEVAIHDGVIEVRFLDRMDNESFADAPSQPRIFQARLQGRTLESL